MSKLTALIIHVCTTVLASILIGGLWWRMWMYHDWIGSPGWLSKILQADGEGSYRATMLEMILISFIVIVAVLYFIKGKGAKSIPGTPGPNLK
jgi:hypothetical protein